MIFLLIITLVIQTQGHFFQNKIDHQSQERIHIYQNLKLLSESVNFNDKRKTQTDQTEKYPFFQPN